MIVLLTGAIGTGKTTYATDKLMQHDEDNKTYKKW
jgi:dephospho-CoA kinase